MREYSGYYFELFENEQRRLDFGLIFQSVFLQGLVYGDTYSLLNSMWLVETSIVIAFDTELKIPRDALI